MREVKLPDRWRGRALVVTGVSTPEQWLSGEELSRLQEFKLETRRQEWTLSRIAAKELAMRLGLCDDARRCSVDRPRLRIEDVDAGRYVSLSHSRPYGAAAVGDLPVGIDVQTLREIPERAAHLFLSDEEQATMERCTIAHRLIHFWCAKEAAWKQRLGATATLKQVPLRLLGESEHALQFDTVETVRIDDLVIALTA